MLTKYQIMEIKEALHLSFNKECKFNGCRSNTHSINKNFCDYHKKIYQALSSINFEIKNWKFENEK